VRGEIPDGADTAQLAMMVSSHPDVVAVYADPQVETCPTCGGDPAVGGTADVAKRLGTEQLADAGYDGSEVPVAVVDTGINVAYLKQQGVQTTVDAAHSWTPAQVGTLPGQHPKAHGSMCAYDVLIAAPEVTLWDHAVLLSQAHGQTVMAGLLSDAVRSYAALRVSLTAMSPDERRLVVSNSWGSFSPAWDFAPGQPGNYSDNAAHPFNLIVGSLEAAGADVLFAAGNCGRDCPDGRCAFGAAPSIGGANSHPKVLSIGGVDVTGARVGYSSQGPGRLSARKPDVCCYTHFTGSKVFAPGPDSGTSAACPVAAGVVAAVRTKFSAGVLSPARLRELVRRTADDSKAPGFDNDYGFGVVDPAALTAKLSAVKALAGV
jgi:subtilisin family serine protease